MVLLWAGSGSLALAKEVSLSPDLGGEDTSKLGDFPVPDLKITPHTLDARTTRLLVRHKRQLGYPAALPVHGASQDTALPDIAGSTKLQVLRP